MDPGVVDSHFHMDRLEEALGSSGLKCVAHMSRKPHIPVRIVGGILNYCDPQHFPRIVYHTISHLGHEVSREGIRPCPSKVREVLDWPRPKNFQ